MTLTGALFADDPFYMLEALRTLGFEAGARPDEQVLRVVGRGGEIPAGQADLFIGNAGTAMRFLTAGLTRSRPSRAMAARCRG